MSLETKREFVVAIGERYRAADRKSKKIILDEFAKVTGYHRKHAIRILIKGKAVVERKSVGKRIYQEAVEESLIVVWEAADRICGKRLKALMPTLVDAMERHGHLKLEETVRATRMADGAADAFALAEIFGWSDVRMALRYTHATDESKRRAVENLAKPIGPSDESVTNEKGRVAALP